LQFGWKGLLISSIVILVHQVVSMTFLFVAAGTAIQFSTEILEQSMPIRTLPWRFIKYSAVFIFCLAGLVLGAGLQAYLGPPVMSAVFST